MIGTALIEECVEIFKEIMVELIRNKEIDIEKIKRERSEFIQEQTEDFQLIYDIYTTQKRYP